MREMGQRIIDMINERNAHKTKSPMMHYCFIKDLMSTSLDLSKIYNNKAYSRYTWDYINNVAGTLVTSEMYPNFRKMEIYFQGL